MKPKHKCWGIGLGRTGTKSLIEALQILGYEKVAHNPPFFEDLLKLDAAAEAGCQVFYKFLDARFPDSKFVVTIRDLKSWLISNQKAFDKYPISRIDASSPYHDAMLRNRMARWGTCTYDKGKLIERYYEHHLGIARHFAGREDQLLWMDIVSGDTWKVLCPFLKVPIPDVAFPHNDL
jgi:hypothetical protein